MNKTRRKALQDIMDQLEDLKADLEDIQSEEEEYRDNIPENLQGSKQYEKADEACDNLGDAISSLEDVVNSVEALLSERRTAMRINYYQFPEGVDAHTRFKGGASSKGGHCGAGKPTCRGCDLCDGGWSECQHYHCDDAEDVVYGCSITAAKKLLKEFGGHAWTEHCERDGSVFEVTAITLNGNNSRFKYNHHL